ncbi:MAG: hypothetical protein AAF531_27575 [Actinomycetota bacterium]
MDQWLLANCDPAGSGPAGGPDGSGFDGDGSGSDGDGDNRDRPTAHEALAAAAAESILRGQDSLSGLVNTVAEARCIGEGVVAEVGLDRYDAAYGVNLRSLEQEQVTVLGVGYDLIDAENVSLVIADCVDLEAVLRSVLSSEGVTGIAHSCVIINGGVERITQMIEAELSFDQQRLQRLAEAMNAGVTRCGG